MPDKSDRPGSSELRPGERISHYEILSLIGRGGMGSVYRARDVNLAREVALKCPSPEVERSPTGRQRFLREARAASALSHPNVVQLYEVFEFDGHPWLAMELVEGRSLRAALDERGRLPILEVVEHAISLAGALQAAHHKHILHRDITPRNVILGRDGRARLTDFGLARSYIVPGEESSASTGLSTLSDSGVVVGTPGYMSPEQVLGQPLDPRSDVFSLGTVLYEMCTGKHAFGPAPSGEQLDAILHREPQPISRHTYEVPEEMERIIRKCLAKRRSERYQDAEDLISDLVALQRGLTPSSEPAPRPTLRRIRWLVGAGAVTALMVLIWWLVSLALSPPAPETSPAALEYYQRGMDYRSRIPNTPEDLKSAAQMFRRAVDEDPRFARGWAALGETDWIWYGRVKGDQALREEAESSVDEALRLDADLPEALAAKGRGLFELHDYTAARAILQSAVNAKPELHDAWANLGKACRELGDRACGLSAMRKAIELEPKNADDQILLGRLLEKFSEYDDAAKAYTRAAELNPKSAIAWSNLGGMYLQRGYPKQAIAPLERAIAVEPRGSALSNLGTAYFQLERYDRAADFYRRAAAVEPSDARHQGNLGDALKMLGKSEESRKAYLEAMRIDRKKVADDPRDARAHMRLGLCCARVGDMQCAIEEGDKGALLLPRDAWVAFRNATIRYLAGRRDEAFDWLEKAAKLGLTRAEIERDPDLRVLASDPRYQRILGLAS